MSQTQLSSSPTHAEETLLPPVDSSLIEEIEAFLCGHATKASLIAPDGSRTDIPTEVYDVLKRVVQAMSQGSAVTVAPVSMRLTTSQAAEMLGISRPTLIRLLEDGAIPYDQPRRHRILRLDDVLAFKRNQDARRSALLDEMTRQSYTDGLYDVSADEYTEALREARR
ncbi:MAG: helix-turn-helix domain-containing protein [Propionibacteriaceae bacterium]|jgi:excisionase family DNA binding protein|nr:helix-turn-helix domain-containing protein [Propionibacteriaceae bacterium]